MKVSKLVKSLENTEYHSRIGANFFTFVYTGSNPAELEKRIKDQLNLLIIDNYKPTFYVTFSKLIRYRKRRRNGLLITDANRRHESYLIQKPIT